MSQRVPLSDDVLRNYVSGRATAAEVDEVERALFERPDLLHDVLAAEGLRRSATTAELVDFRRPPAAAAPAAAAARPMPRERYAWAAALLLAVGLAYTGIGWHDDARELARLRGAGVANVAVVPLAPSRGAATGETPLAATAGGFVFELSLAPPYEPAYEVRVESASAEIAATARGLTVDERGRLSVFVPGPLRRGESYVLVLAANHGDIARYPLRVR